jgi:hypothetical protein
MFPASAFDFRPAFCAFFTFAFTFFAPLLPFWDFAGFELLLEFLAAFTLFALKFFLQFFGEFRVLLLEFFDPLLKRRFFTRAAARRTTRQRRRTQQAGK